MSLKKLEKWLLILLFTLAAALCIVYFSIYHHKNTFWRPYPYKVSHFLNKPSKYHENSQVLIIGDQNVDYYQKFVSELEELLQNNQLKNLRINAVSLKDNNLARILFYLKALKKLPPVIVYFISKNEFLEKKFNFNDYEAIKKNFSFFNDQKLSSLIYLLPFLSKFFYEDYQSILYLKGSLNSLPIRVEESDKQKIHEIYFKIYEEELLELIDYVYQRKSKLIIISNPVNLKTIPTENCKDSKKKNAFMEKLKGLLNAKKTKNAFTLLNENIHLYPFDPNVHYLYGDILLENNSISQAIKHYEYAKIFDCNLSYNSPIINKIAKKIATKMNISYIDFHTIVNRDLGKNSLFLNSLYPQHYYYELLNTVLGSKLIDILKL